ncbi:MAG: inositol monophosphatase family protein [Drouetiella hepatica Uher 2000/2452]|jgi:myo-inositol-1(or 4)-monophosphatase|uniref:inositol-phosphate phosphatase n=1 Tax=Drouetiella hepatica Uher 2000/2452 TaxID=904376 RepID=A0A951QC37_9CYAN|nr:inositol monophosphatase family protein [Drouetiella hepatica Uher 2000/2452]
MDWSEILNFAETVTDRVGVQLLKDFGHAQANAVEKTDGSLVTPADQWADAELRSAIAQAFPDHGFLSEESEHIFPENDWCWVIDPIDGTTNFARGLPLWAISLGLLYKGTPVFGYVHLPPLRQSFHGFWCGGTDTGSAASPSAVNPAVNLAIDPSLIDCPVGAFLNHQPVHPRRDIPSGNQFFNICARSTAVLQQPLPCKVRMLGASTYNLLTVAAGISLGGVEATPKIWDIAAVWAIVKAAGGSWVSLDPEPIFPLQDGQNYGSRAYPTLVVSRAELVPIFQPIVRFLGKT